MTRELFKPPFPRLYHAGEKAKRGRLSGVLQVESSLLSARYYVQCHLHY